MSRTGYLGIGLAAAAATVVLLLSGPDSGNGGEPSVAAEAAQGPRADTLTAPGVPERVTEYLRNGQSWRAARAMREVLDGAPEAAPEAVLLAARAEAGWGGWDRVRGYLEGRAWLDGVRAGEGWYLLGRALEAEEEWEPAYEAYERYLAGPPAEQPADRRSAAELRQGLVLLRLGRAEEGAALLTRMRERAPEIAPRVDVLAAEALAERGDTAAVRRLAGAEAPDLRRRGTDALLEAYEVAGDSAGALALARAARAAAGSAAERAPYALRAARLALARRDTAAAREELRRLLAEAPGAGAARPAADLLGSLPGLTDADRFSIAGVLNRHGADRDAARFYRAWLAAETGTEEQRRQVRLQLGRALLDSGDAAGAVATLAPLTDAAGELGAEAMFRTAQAESRRGNQSRARQVYLSLAERHPRTEQGSQGLFLIADLSHDAGERETAGSLYRRVATEFPGTDRAGLSLMRLAGLAYHAGDFAGAARAWEEYRSTYPDGERWLESTYWAARAHERGGDAERAAGLYRAARTRDPLSYYALRSAERLGEPYWPIPTGPAPPEDPAARERVEGWLRGADLLREAGLHAEAESEADVALARAGEDPTLLYPLAEALNERGYTVRGIRTGLRLQRAAPVSNPRLLRIVYPFPYRAMIEAEAREQGLDPFLVAALIRQESTFKARIASPVGARGLMQVMPQTGAGLAAGVGIRDWDAELLYQPEINAHLGMRFLADQMRAYRGSLPSVFSAYNAGPSRISRWSDFPEYSDEELFTERIPYRETRDYVKILTRNIAIYQRLYGE